MTPSRTLPTLHPLPSRSILEASVNLLEARFNQTHQVVDLRSPSTARNDDDTASTSQSLQTVEANEEEDDSFELDFTRNWIERLIQLSLRRIARNARVGEEEEWENLIERCSAILSNMAGPSASGKGSTIYILPSSRTKTNFNDTEGEEGLSIEIHDGTLLSATTGHRTWGSAPLLATRIAQDPLKYLLSSWIKVDGYHSPREQQRQYIESTSPNSPSPHNTDYHNHNPRTLRILELGSGTGLVGIATASIFDHYLATLDSIPRTTSSSSFPSSSPTTPLSNLSSFQVKVVLSDGGESNETIDEGRTAAQGGAVFENLKENVERYRRSRVKEQVAEAQKGGGREGKGEEVEIETRILRWDDYLPRSDRPSSRSTTTIESKLSDDGRGEEEELFDIILGADLVYEPSQASSLYHTVRRLLKIPTTTHSLNDSNSSIDPSMFSRSTFHLMIPLRSTHTFESNLVDLYFPQLPSRSSSSPLHSPPPIEFEPPPKIPSFRSIDLIRTIPSSSSVDGKSPEQPRSVQLFTIEREEFVGPDRFGGGRGESRRSGARSSSTMMGEGEMRYRRYRIEWREVG